MTAAVTARAALAREVSAPFSVEPIAVAAPGPGEVRVRLAGAGICHTDLVCKNGFPVPMPIVLGHEGSGIVESVGPGVSTLQPGDAVVLSFNSCGGCPRCVDAQPAYCFQFMAHNFAGVKLDGSSPLSQQGAVVHGNFFGQSSFAEYAIASVRNTVKVDADLPLALLGPLGCGIQTGAGAVLRSLALKRGQSIAIFGGGAVGLAAVMAAKAVDAAAIVVVEPNAGRRALALSLGATQTIDPTAEADVLAAVRAASGGGVTHAFDTTGIPAVIGVAVEAVLPGGLCGLVGVSPMEASVPANLMSLLMRGVGVKAILEGDSDPQTFIPELIALYRAGKFPFDRLIKTFPFEAINDAVHASETGAVIKPVVVF